MEFFETSNSGLLETARKLAIDGAVFGTYKSRIDTLARVLTPREVCNFSKTKNPRKKKQPEVLGLEYNCWDNVRAVIEKVIGDCYSVTFDWNCANQSCDLPKQTNMVL